MSVTVPRDSGEFSKAWLSLFEGLASVVNALASEDGQTIRATQYDDATRPTLGAQDAGVIIFNTGDGVLNVWDGAQWTLTDGTAT